MNNNCDIPEINKVIEILYSIPDMSDSTKQKICDFITREMINDIKRKAHKEEVDFLNETHTYKLYIKNSTTLCIPLSFHARTDNLIDYKCHKYQVEKNAYMASYYTTSVVYSDEFDTVYKEVTLDDAENMLKRFKFINATSIIEDIKEKLNKK